MPNNQRKAERKKEIARIHKEGRQAGAAGQHMQTCPKEYLHTMDEGHWKSGHFEGAQQTLDLQEKQKAEPQRGVDKTRLVKALEFVSKSIEEDIASSDIHPFNQAFIGKMFAHQAAAITVLAGIVKQLIEEKV